MQSMKTVADELVDRNQVETDVCFFEGTLRKGCFKKVEPTLRLEDRWLGIVVAIVYSLGYVWFAFLKQQQQRS